MMIVATSGYDPCVKFLAIFVTCLVSLQAFAYQEFDPNSDAYQYVQTVLESMNAEAMPCPEFRSDAGANIQILCATNPFPDSLIPFMDAWEGANTLPDPNRFSTWERLPSRNGIYREYEAFGGQLVVIVHRARLKYLAFVFADAGQVLALGQE